MPKPSARALTVASAFTTRGQALCFLGGLILLLCLPIFLAWAGVTRQHSFSEPYDKEASFSYYRNEIFGNSDDIDILFTGPCTIWWHVRADVVQRGLEEQLGHPMRVRNFGFNHFGEDLVYLLVRDTLARHKVKVLVLATPRSGDGSLFPHPNAFMWWQYPSDFSGLRELALLDHFFLYAASEMGSLRTLSLLGRRHAVAGMDPQASFLGSKRRESDSHTPVEFPKVTLSTQQMLFTRWADADLELESPGLQANQMAVLKSIVHMAESAGTRVVFLSSPLAPDFETERLRERENWFQIFGGRVPLIGIPPALLKSQLNSRQLEGLFQGDNLTAEGSDFYTRALIPALAQVYAGS